MLHRVTFPSPARPQTKFRIPNSEFRIPHFHLSFRLVVFALLIQLTLFAMTIVGAFLAALPERIRRRKEPRLRSTWQGCLVCFGAGFVMVLAAGLARMNGQLLLGLLQGSASAYVFAAVAWIAALVAARIKERRRRT